MLESVNGLLDTVKTDIYDFIESLEHDPFDANLLNNYGLKNQNVIDALKRAFYVMDIER